MVESIALGVLGVAIAVIGGAGGAAVGISMAAPAIAGAGTEKPEIVSRNLISVILAEALGLYGFVIFFVASGHLTPEITSEQAFRVLGGGLVMGLSALAAGFGIGRSGSAMASAMAERPELFGRAVLGIIFSEALALYAFVTAFILIG